MLIQSVAGAVFGAIRDAQRNHREQDADHQIQESGALNSFGLVDHSTLVARECGADAEQMLLALAQGALLRRERERRGRFGRHGLRRRFAALSPPIVETSRKHELKEDCGDDGKNGRGIDGNGTRIQRV